MKTIKWIDKENCSHYSNKEWVCNIYKRGNMWHWSVDHENALVDFLDDRTYQGDVSSLATAKFFCEKFLQSDIRESFKIGHD